MRAEEARRLSVENQKRNDEFQKFIRYTENDIKQAIENGRRKAVLFLNYSLRESLINYWESMGYRVIREPPKTTYYVVW